MIDVISKKLIELEFKKQNPIKNKCLKFAVKKTLTTIWNEQSKNWKRNTYCLVYKKRLIMNLSKGKSYINRLSKVQDVLFVFKEIKFLKQNHSWKILKPKVFRWVL